MVKLVGPDRIGWGPRFGAQGSGHKILDLRAYPQLREVAI